jgi:hypothetical protein
MESKIVEVVEHFGDEIRVCSSNSEEKNYYVVNLNHPNIYKRCECPGNIFQSKKDKCKHEKRVIAYLEEVSSGHREPVDSFPTRVIEQHGDEFIVADLTPWGVEYNVVRPEHPLEWERCECFRSRFQFKEGKCRHEKELERYLLLLKEKKIRPVPTYSIQRCLYC